MRAILAIVLVLFPGLGWAQALPAVYDVTGVASNDVLNIREQPVASAQLVGTLGYDERGIEVVQVSDNGRWGLVSTGEGNGWVAMRYLVLRQDVNPMGVLRPMRCGGTEPFWTLGLGTEGDSFDEPWQGSHALTALGEIAAPPGFAVTFVRAPGEQLALTVQRGACSDGMSDRLYGFTASVLMRTPEGDQLFFGCCTLDLR